MAFLLAFLFHATSNVLVTGLFSGLLTFAYFVVFEVTQGWTPAKKLLGLSVHGPGGAPKPTAQQSAIRNSFTLLSVIPWLGGLLAVVAYIVIAVTINNSPTKQGKHDELAGALRSSRAELASDPVAYRYGSSRRGPGAASAGRGLAEPAR